MIYKGKTQLHFPDVSIKLHDQRNTNHEEIPDKPKLRDVSCTLQKCPGNGRQMKTKELLLIKTLYIGITTNATCVPELDPEPERNPLGLTINT
jgi:hypothetical protein